MVRVPRLFGGTPGEFGGYQIVERPIPGCKSFVYSVCRFVVFWITLTLTALSEIVLLSEGIHYSKFRLHKLCNCLMFVIARCLDRGINRFRFFI